MRRKYKNRTGVGVIAFVVLILCGIVAYRRIGLEKESYEKNLTINRLEAAYQEQVERKQEIDDFRLYSQTPQCIEDIAREKLGLVYEDEIIFEAQE